LFHFERGKQKVRDDFAIATFEPTFAQSVGHSDEVFEEGGAEIIPLGKVIHPAHVHQLRQEW